MIEERNKNQLDKLANMSKARDIFNSITENFPVQTENETKEWEKKFFSLIFWDQFYIKIKIEKNEKIQKVKS
jgi:hypothetical protein